MRKIFETDGILSQTLPNFSSREEQLDMALAVEHAITHKEKLVIEAGTGTGKTFAYLVPVFKSNKKTVISTGSKNLQDQLFKKDLPLIKKALKYTGKIVLLKGRANYLCVERLNQLMLAGFIGDKSLLADLTKIREWQISTTTGDFSECKGLNENSPLLAQINSNHEDCNPSDHFNCYINKIRKQALDADIIIVNHHLFFADLAIKEKGFNELIPNVDAVIFDEAHQLPDIASRHFSQSLYSKQLFELSQEIIILYRTELKDLKSLDKAADLIKKATNEIRLAMPLNTNKGSFLDLLKKSDITKQLNQLERALTFTLEIIKTEQQRENALNLIKNKIDDFLEILNNLLQANLKNFCYWYETTNSNFSMYITPLSVAEKFSNKLKSTCSWIFTSATLSIDNNVEYFTRRLGIQNYIFKILSSPFDYMQQALLCVPRNLPRQNTVNTGKELLPIILPLIEANSGNCFILCTSYNMVNQLSEQMQSLSNFNILTQSTASKIELLEQFIKQDNTVLIGTSSFWEGVDVKGDALSLVIIDKLPFTSPDDPLLKAKIEICRENKQDPFQLIQLPEAVISLKQGFGRLIRDTKDRGAVVICDARLVTNTYGATFLKSLPPTKRTRNTKKVIEFITDKSETKSKL